MDRVYNVYYGAIFVRFLSAIIQTFNLQSKDHPFHFGFTECQTTQDKNSKASNGYLRNETGYCEGLNLKSFIPPRWLSRSNFESSVPFAYTCVTISCFKTLSQTVKRYLLSDSSQLCGCGRLEEGRNSALLSCHGLKGLLYDVFHSLQRQAIRTKYLVGFCDQGEA